MPQRLSRSCELSEAGQAAAAAKATMGLPSPSTKTTLTATTMLTGLAVVAVALVALIETAAQHTEATCLPGYEWTFNSLQQSPCLVTAYLGTPCSSDGDYEVPILFTGQHYSPSDNPGPCECSTVMYSMISACAACQNGDIDSYQDYKSNCTNTPSPGTFPFTIPRGTAVPHWAFDTSVASTNRFNVTLAQQEGDSPESIASAATSSSNAPAGTAPAPANHKKSTPIGAIVGGAVGGVVVLGLIGALIAFFMIRSKKKKQAPSQQFAGYSDSSAVNGNGTIADEKRYSYYPVSPGSTGYAGSPPPQTTTTFAPTMPFKPYNPDDPSTFPSTPMSSGPTSGSTVDAPSNYQTNPYEQQGVIHV